MSLARVHLQRRPAVVYVDIVGELLLGFLLRAYGSRLLPVPFANHLCVAGFIGDFGFRQRQRFLLAEQGCGRAGVPGLPEGNS